MKTVLSFKKPLLLASAALISISFTACKENTIIKSGTVDVVDNINTFAVDFPVTSGTIYDDSVYTSYKISPVYVGLGSIDGQDNVFGDTRSSVYFSVVPAATGYRFPRNITIDSAVLILPYSGFAFGDTANTSKTQTFTVHEMTDTMAYDTMYYSSMNLAYNPAEIGRATVNTYNLKNEVVIGKDTIDGVLYIKLDKTSFLDKIIAINRSADSTKFDTYSDFISSVFKGFHVKTTGTGTSIPYFQLDGSDYFSKAGVLFFSKDSIITAFSYNTNSNSHYNKIEREYSAALAQNYIAPKNVHRSDSVFFVQNKPGLAADLMIRGIVDTLQNRVPSKNLLINKASLIITKVSWAADNAASKYAEPARLYPVGVDADTTYSIADRYPLTSSAPLDFMDGISRQVTVGGITVTQYVINLPKEVQKCFVTGKNDLHLRINGTTTFYGAYRLVAGGGTHSTFSIKMNVIYSKLN